MRAEDMFGRLLGIGWVVCRGWGRWKTLGAHLGFTVGWRGWYGLGRALGLDGEIGWVEVGLGMDRGCSLLSRACQRPLGVFIKKFFGLDAPVSSCQPVRALASARGQASSTGGCFAFRLAGLMPHHCPPGCSPAVWPVLPLLCRCHTACPTCLILVSSRLLAKHPSVSSCVLVHAPHTACLPICCRASGTFRLCLLFRPRKTCLPDALQAGWFPHHPVPPTMKKAIFLLLALCVAGELGVAVGVGEEGFKPRGVALHLSSACFGWVCMEEVPQASGWAMCLGNGAASPTLR